MKRILLLSAALGALMLLTTSCVEDILCRNGNGPITEEEITVGSFTGIKVATNANVYLSRGTDQKVVVKVQESVLEDLNIDVLGDILVIDLQGCHYSYDLDVYVTVSEPLTDVIISGSGDVISETALPAAAELKLDLLGSGEMNLDLDAKAIETEISGSGSVNLEGLAETHKLVIAGSGKLRAFGLETADYEINISGSGFAEVFLNGALDASISGSGSIFYKGNPSSINTRVTGSGKIVDSN